MAIFLCSLIFPRPGERIRSKGSDRFCMAFQSWESYPRLETVVTIMIPQSWGTAEAATMTTESNAKLHSSPGGGHATCQRVFTLYPCEMEQTWPRLLCPAVFSFPDGCGTPSLSTHPSSSRSHTQEEPVTPPRKEEAGVSVGIK